MTFHVLGQTCEQTSLLKKIKNRLKTNTQFLFVGEKQSSNTLQLLWIGKNKAIYLRSSYIFAAIIKMRDE